MAFTVPAVAAMNLEAKCEANPDFFSFVRTVFIPFGSVWLGRLISLQHTSIVPGAMSNAIFALGFDGFCF